MSLLSVIMPVYNADVEDFKRAADSVLKQTFSDFEFIIIDDGSDDYIEDIALSFDDKRIRFIKNQTNLGIVKSLNYGLGISSGKYIARLDSDDYSDLSRFEKQIAFLEANPDTGLLGSFMIDIQSKDEVRLPTDSNDIKLCLRYLKNVMAHSAVMYRRDVLLKNNLRYNENCLCAEDYKLWIDMSYYCEIANLPEFLLYYKRNEAGITSQNHFFQAKMANFIKLSCMMKDFGKNKNELYPLLIKFAGSERFSPKEYENIRDLLFDVKKYVYENISDEFKPFVNSDILQILKYINVKNEG